MSVRYECDRCGQPAGKPNPTVEVYFDGELLSFDLCEDCWPGLREFLGIEPKKRPKRGRG